MKVLKICECVIFFLAILNLLVGFWKLKRGSKCRIYKTTCLLGYILAGSILVLSFCYNIVLDNGKSTLILLTGISAMLLTFQLSSFIQGLNSFFKIRVMYILQSIIFFILCEVLCIVSLLIF